LPPGLPTRPVDAGDLSAARALPVLPLSAVERLTGGLANAPLSELRRLTIEMLLRSHPDLIEADENGQPIVRGEVLAIGVDDATVSRLRRAGFIV
jgi:hypothetical protein